MLINPVVPIKLKVDKEETLRTANVLPSCVERYVVLTKFARFAVEIWFAKFAVDTKLARFAVDTKLTRLAVLTKFAKLAVLINEPKLTVEIYPNVPRPIIVLVRFACTSAVGEF